MAAGLGFKTFTTGEVLTAADTNGYLMQGVLVFDDATARDAAITAPVEGQFAYLKDTNVTTYYTGSAWANLDTTGMTNPMTTTADMIYSSSGSTPARLGIGTVGQVLTVNSGATAPEWAAPAGGGKTWTLLNIGGTSLTAAATITISSISDKDDILLYFNAASAVNASAIFQCIINGDSGSNYDYNGPFDNVGSSYSATNFQSQGNINYSGFNIAKTGNSAANQAHGGILLSGCKGNNMVATVLGRGSGTSTEGWHYVGIYKGAAALTSIALTSNNGNFDNGTLYVWGA